jgi:hypothetical protein
MLKFSNRIAARTSASASSTRSRKPQAASYKPAGTVIRSVLRLPVSPFTIHTSLFDMTGRQAMALRPGANDVSELSPGVYFVREEPQATSLKPQAIRKVVLTE